MNHMEKLTHLTEALNAEAFQVLDELCYVPSFKAPMYAERFLKLRQAYRVLREAPFQPELNINVPDEEL